MWTVSADGGIARRLTSGLGAASHPALSTDGRWLAFSGRDEGSLEVYVMPAEGGEARRLTYLGANTLVVGWTHDGRVIFSSNAEQAFGGPPRLWTIGTDGGAPELLPTGPAQFISFGPNGGCVIGRNAPDPARWKRYRGGTAGDLWIDRTGKGQFRPAHRDSMGIPRVRSGSVLASISSPTTNRSAICIPARRPART